MDYPALLDAYLAGPNQLRSAVAGLSREQLIARPVAGRWSALEVVCHLADTEAGWSEVAWVDIPDSRVPDGLTPLRDDPPAGGPDQRERRRPRTSS
jgi:hypothetical protein